MQKIKVLHIVKSLGRGGAEILLLETLKKHNKNKFEFYYIFFLPWKNALVTDLEKCGAKVFNFKANNPLQMLVQCFAIAKFIKKNNLQLVHCHLPWAGIVARLVRVLVPIKLMYTEHNIQERYHAFTGFINRITYGMQDLVIPVSHEVQISIQKNIRRHPPLQMIYNGVDTDYLVQNAAEKQVIRQQLQISEDAVVMGNVCVFRKQKRLDKWVELFEQALLKNDKLVGLLVGAGPLFEQIKNLVQEKGLTEKIRFTGATVDVKQYLNIIDVFVTTSEFEGLPIALLEAMSMQCAVVATNVGGTKEVIINGENGFCTSFENVETLFSPIIQLAQNTDLRIKIGNAARATVVNKFSVQSTTQQLEVCYCQLTLD